MFKTMLAMIALSFVAVSASASAQQFGPNTSNGGNQGYGGATGIGNVEGNVYITPPAPVQPPVAARPPAVQPGGRSESSECPAGYSRVSGGCWQRTRG
jgi:hypothetical protein